MYVSQNALLKEQMLTLRRENALQVQALQTQVRFDLVCTSLAVCGK